MAIGTMRSTCRRVAPIALADLDEHSRWLHYARAQNEYTVTDAEHASLVDLLTTFLALATDGRPPRHRASVGACFSP